MASNFSGVLDEASCYMSSVSSSPRLSPLTSFSHLPYPSLLRRGQRIIQPFPLSLFDTKEYMSVFSRAILGPITCILLSPLPWQLFLFHSFSFFSSLIFLPRNIKYSHLFHLKKKKCKHPHMTPYPTSSISLQASMSPPTYSFSHCSLKPPLV